MVLNTRIRAASALKPLSTEEKVLGIVRWMGANPTTTKQAYLPQTAIINHSALYNIERFSYLTMGKRL